MALAEKQNRRLTVSSDFLLNLAGELNAEWPDLGRYLNLSVSSLHNIKEDNIRNTKEAKFQMLMCWKEENGQDATHSRLADALVKAGRKDLSEGVKKEEYKVNKRSLENDPFSEQTTRSSKMHRPTPEHSVNRCDVGEGPMMACLKEKKTEFVKQLRKKYRNLCGKILPVPFLRDKYDIDEVYVEGGMKYLDGKQRRGTTHEKWIEMKTYKTVLTHHRAKSNRRRIIDGPPGYGKSMIALQIANDWCNEQSTMNDVEILILLRLRQCRNVPTVYSAIKKFLLPKDSKLTEYEIEGILDSSSTLVLLDGYDEYPGRGKEDSDIERIIRGDMFQKHEVILTTRTSCLPPGFPSGTQRIRLTGFDDSAKETYIRNVVAGGSSEDADRIKHFFRDNTVPEEIIKNPMFFAMISFMVHLEERFLNFKSVTDFFRHIVKCFNTHDQTKPSEGMRRFDLENSALCKITFEGLCKDSSQMSWGKNELISKMGKKLYNECLRIGLLIEEEGYDFYAMEYKIDTTFYHKLFVEWFAGHYLGQEAARQGRQFEHWLESLLYDPRKEVSMIQRMYAIAIGPDEQLLNSLDPNYVHYMYRFACGLCDDVAMVIIGLLSKEDNYDSYTLLCITEWGGSLEKIESAITLLCSRTINFRDDDSKLLQVSSVKLIKFASDRKIPIAEVYLSNCLSIDSTGNLRVQPSNLSLPVIDTSISELTIYEYGRVITEEETDSILQYAAKCRGLKTLWFSGCLLPQYVHVTDSVSFLRSMGVTVAWFVSLGGSGYYLSLSSGRWEHSWVHDYSPMTDEQYHREEETVKKKAEALKEMTDSEDDSENDSESDLESDEL